jgi:hypothetical protein
LIILLALIGFPTLSGLLSEKFFMHIAREKIKNDIGGYFLYMFQIEDLIRACKFDPVFIEEKLVSRYAGDLSEKSE